MKIGILTLTPKNNYGGILQATALCGYLESLGHDVVIINKIRFKKTLFLGMAMNFLEHFPFQNIRNKRQEYLKTRQLKPFIEKNLPRKSREIVSSNDLQALVEEEKFDAVVVGSDQVWRYKYIGDGYHNVYFLDFNTDKPVLKIAYAASFGKGKWEAPEYIPEISFLLRKFDVISTREKSGVELCENIFDISGVERVLDPTMLVGAEFYDRFFERFNVSAFPKSIVTYILDKSEEKQEIITLVKEIFEHRNGPLRQLNLSEKVNKRFYGVEEWLWSIKNAEFVVTDSFHGMVFSIIFQKQFVVIGNVDRGISRFRDLLDDLGLSYRLVYNKENVKKATEIEIEYSEVMDIISVMRERSSLIFETNK